MKLGLQLGYWGQKPTPRFVELAQRAEALGFEWVFTAEAYGADCFTPLTAIAAQTSRIKLGTAIMQISARTPACAAATALTLDHISGGRVCLGIGVSGPQVVEGWYGAPFARPLERTREWLDIFRKIEAREEPLVYEGRQYQLPYRGPGSTNQGKALKAITYPLRKRMPVYLAAEGPKNIALAAERFDGWLPMMLAPRRLPQFAPHLAKKSKDFEIIATVPVSISDDWEEARAPVKQMLALYVGGMGSKEENFHKRMVESMGFVEAAQKIQDLWLSGRQQEAVAVVPDNLVDEIGLVGPPAHIRERLAVWKASEVTGIAMSHARDFDTTVRNMELLTEALR